jgi:hypothetical protein
VVLIFVRTTRGLISIGQLVSGAVRSLKTTGIGHSIILFPLPITAVAFEGELMEFGKALKSREVKQVILDPIRYTFVGCMLERSVVPPISGRGSGKVNEIPRCLMMLLHDDFLELDFGLGCVVEITKVEFEFGLEQIPIGEPGRLGLDLAEDDGLAILKCRFSKVRDGILDLG